MFPAYAGLNQGRARRHVYTGVSYLWGNVYDAQSLTAYAGLNQGRARRHVYTGMGYICGLSCRMADDVAEIEAVLPVFGCRRLVGHQHDQRKIL